MCRLPSVNVTPTTTPTAQAKGERVSLEMKCPQCGHDNPEGAQFCSSCGAALNTATARRIRRAIKVWLVGGLTGLVTGL